MKKLLMPFMFLFVLSMSFAYAMDPNCDSGEMSDADKDHFWEMEENW